MKYFRNVLSVMLLTVLAGCSATPSTPVPTTPGGLERTGSWVVREDEVIRIAAGAEGKGTLLFLGWEHPFSFTGAKVTFTGAENAEIVGTVYNLKKVEDFAGTYTPTADFDDGKLEGIWAKNENGVVIYASTENKEMLVNMKATGATVKLID